MGASGGLAGGGGGGAAEHGYIAESLDPGIVNAQAGLTSGWVFCIRMWVPRPATVTNICLHVITGGATLTAGQNLLGLYTDAGVKMSETADQSTAWTTTGSKVAPLLTPQAVNGGAFYRVLLLCVGTTPPVLPRGNSGAASGTSMGLSAAALRFSRVSTGATALPASFTPSSVVDSSSPWCVTLT